jgi:thiazole synthase ThiGH ThiG subunit
MARAIGLAATAGYEAARAGPMAQRFLGRASSPTEGVPWRG